MRIKLCSNQHVLGQSNRLISFRYDLITVYYIITLLYSTQIVISEGTEAKHPHASLYVPQQFSAHHPPLFFEGICVFARHTMQKQWSLWIWSCSYTNPWWNCFFRFLTSEIHWLAIIIILHLFFFMITISIELEKNHFKIVVWEKYNFKN